MAKRLLRKALSAPGLLRVVRACFDEVNDPVSGRRFSLSDCHVGAGGVRAEVPVAASVRPRCAHRRGGAGESEGSVQRLIRAPMRHRAARATRRGGPARAARCVQARVRAAPARQGAGGVHLPGRALSALGRRHRLLLLVARALQELLREAPQRRDASRTTTRCWARWWCIPSSARSSPSRRSPS